MIVEVVMAVKVAEPFASAAAPFASAVASSALIASFALIAWHTERP